MAPPVRLLVVAVLVALVARPGSSQLLAQAPQGSVSGPQLLPPQPAPLPDTALQLQPPQPLNAPTPVTIGTPQATNPPVTSGPPPVPPPSILQPRETPAGTLPIVPETPPPAPAVFWPPGVLPPGVELIDGIFFAGLGGEGVKAQAINHLQGQVTRNNGSSFELQVPSQPFNWTFAPTFMVGLRLPNNNGQFTLDYTFLNTTGEGIFPELDAAANIKTRLSNNIFHLDYTSGFYDLGFPGLTLKGIVGARVVSIFYDTTATRTYVQDVASNYFLGVGPEGGAELAYNFRELPALSVYARTDGSVLVGQIKQKYSEVLNDTGNNLLNGTAEFRRTQSVPTINLEAGIIIAPEAIKALKFTIGYQWEEYWSLGRLNGSSLDLTMQGAFLRAQYEF